MSSGDGVGPPARMLALVGPTASGKSSIALRVAERLGAEVVAVDAFTVYRGMDVGTAKPSPEVRARVPHHMVDVLEPTDDCTVGWFQPRARAAIDDVVSAGRLPLLVGGSGLYFRAVVDDLRFPPTDEAVRTALEQRWQDDPAAGHALLAEQDPQAAARIDPENLRRTVRALEVIELTGRPFSAWRTSWDDYETIYPGLVVVGVEVDRSTLETRIAARVDAMLAEGFVDECRTLVASDLSTSARQAIGYQEMFAHLEGRTTLEEAAAAIRARTRRYAARQQRWFRADPRVQWTAADRAEEQLLAAAA